MNYKKILIQNKAKTITREALSSLLMTSSDKELFNHVVVMEKEGLIEKVKASSTNGNFAYPIYNKYRILVKEEINDDEVALIKNLHPLIKNKERLLKNVAEFHKYKLELSKLDAYLFRNKINNISVSRKERSFEIFGEEKCLDDKTFCNFLKNIGITEKELNFYDTPEYCFNDFIPLRKDDLTLLILENKDIWFNLRRRMYEDNCNVFLSAHIDGVIYGCGNRISERNALSEYSKFMSLNNISYLYWGDIDREGLNIFLKLKKANPELDIKLFVPAYVEMLHRSKNYMIPDSLDKREIVGDYQEIYDLFVVEDQEILRNLIENNKRLPQEIINYAYLVEVTE